MDNNRQQSNEQEQDRHLQSPGEANRDKHINFNALEEGDEDPADVDEGTELYLTDNSTLQSPIEKEHDNAVNPRNDNSISVSEDDLHDANAGRITGRESLDERAMREESGKNE